MGDLILGVVLQYKLLLAVFSGGKELVLIVDISVMVSPEAYLNVL